MDAVKFPLSQMTVFDGTNWDAFESCMRECSAFSGPGTSSKASSKQRKQVLEQAPQAQDPASLRQLALHTSVVSTQPTRKTSVQMPQTKTLSRHKLPGMRSINEHLAKLRSILINHCVISSEAQTMPGRRGRSWKSVTRLLMQLQDLLCSRSS
jgi:hypothetical protein